MNSIRVSRRGDLRFAGQQSISILLSVTIVSADWVLGLPRRMGASVLMSIVG